MKLAVNSLIAVTNQALAEALVLTERGGIDRATAYETLKDSAIASPYVRYKQGAFVDPENEPLAFTVGWCSGRSASRRRSAGTWPCRCSWQRRRTRG